MSQESGMVDPIQGLEQLRNALDELGASESVDTALAFMVVQLLGDAMRQGYTKRKENTVRELVGLSEKYKSNEKTIALGALVDAFLIGWIGVDKMA